MPLEIERKFLVKSDDYRNWATKVFIRQGYICSDVNRIVRVRIAGNQAFITIKGKTESLTRLEFEYEIPVNEANPMLDSFCERPLIEKYRYTLSYSGSKWEIDEFFGENEGLIVAEIELDNEDQTFVSPPWLGKEVSRDHRFGNSHLVTKPYSSWKNKP